MKTRMVLRIVPILMVLLWIASAAYGQELSVFAGGVFPGSCKYHETTTSLDDSPLYGLRVSVPFVLALKLEGSLSLSHDFLFPSELPGITDAKGLLADANLVLGIPLGKIVPFVTAGIGIIHQYGSESLPVGTKFGVNYGGGLKIPKLLGPAGLRFDARGRSALGVFSSVVNMFEFSGGVMFSF